MSQILQDARHRFMTNLRNPVMRHNVAVLMAGKILGLGILIALMVTFLPSFAHAQGGGPDATAQINAINTAWTLIAAFLVFGMQVGFVMLEAGFARAREFGEHSRRRYRGYVYLRDSVLGDRLRIHVRTRYSLILAPPVSSCWGLTRHMVRPACRY